MPITFRCSDCTQKLRIDDNFAGKRVACVRCGSKQRVPLVSSPEFASPAVVPPKPSRETTPPPTPASPPKEQEPARRESRRRKFSSPEGARCEPIPFEPVELSEVEPPRIEPEPPQPERALPEPVFSERAVEEPAAEEDHLDRDVFQRSIFEDDVSEPDIPERAPPISNLQESGLPKSAALESTLHESALRESALAAQFPAEQLQPREVRPLKSQPVPRTRRAAPRAESSLVPPYKKLDVEEMIDMTAMVDIVFFLLIFFLVTSMHALDSTIPMPTPDPQKGAAREPRSVAAIDADDSYVVVRIDRNDKISVEGSEVRSDRDLLFKLRDLRLSAAHPEKLLVVGHGDATHGTVVMVLDTGRELGMDQVRLTMQDEAD